MSDKVKRLLCLAAGVSMPALLEAADPESPGIAGHFFSTFWAIASFLVVLFILWKKLLPPIVTALDERARDIRDALDSAEKARADAEEMIKRHEEDLDKARHESRAIIEEGKADAERLKDRIVQDARREAEEISARTRREIELAKNAALDDMHRQCVDLSLDLAGRLVQKSLDPADHQKLIQERIRSFSSSEGS